MVAEVRNDKFKFKFPRGAKCEKMVAVQLRSNRILLGDDFPLDICERSCMFCRVAG